MSLPPQIIQVKRLKRKARDDDDDDADGIVDYLRSYLLTYLLARRNATDNSLQESTGTGNDIVAIHISTSAALILQPATRVRLGATCRVMRFP